MTRRENMLRTITRTGPEYVPINAEYSPDWLRKESDCVVEGYREVLPNEWGYAFTHLEDDQTMGQVTQHPLALEEDAWAWNPPPVEAEKRFAGLRERIQAQKDQDLFVWGGIGSFVFERMHYLRGMPQLFEDMALDPELVRQLGNRIVDFQCEVIRGYAQAGADGIWGGDDWGLQDRLMISPTMWREFFKPWYERMFRTAHECGLFVYMHSCGKNNDIISDLIDCGLDVIELHQPTVYGVDWLAEHAAGKLCFSTTADIQRTLPYGDREKIEDEVRALREKLYRNGGLMYIVYGSLEAIGVDDATMADYVRLCKKYA